MKIQEKLKKLRLNLDLTQREVADGADIERVSYNRYENGTRVPTGDAVVSLAKFFRCTTDYLLGVTNEPNLVHYKTGYMYEGSEVIINIVEDAVKNGLTEKDIKEFIEMGKMWRKMQEKKDQ